MPFVPQPEKPSTGRDLERERRRRAKRHFLDRHPLARLYEAISYAYLERRKHCYDRAGHSALRFAQALANLEPALLDELDPLLPHRPSVHYPEGSDIGWVTYLSAHWMSPSVREGMRDAIRTLIAERFGEDHVPIIHDQFTCVASPEHPF